MLSRNLKFFLGGFILSLPIFWGGNVFQKNLEDFLFWQKIADNPQILAAQIIQQQDLENLKPIRDWQIPNLELNAKSAISVLVDSEGNRRTLFSKDSAKPLPIASLTKLMTAEVVLENYNLSQTIKITRHAMSQKDDAGFYKIGETFSAEGLLYSSLMESSNDAVLALSGLVSDKAFVELMNMEAKSLGLGNSYFVNPTGLDPDNFQGPINYSTSQDLSKLAAFLLENKPKIMEISRLRQYDLYTASNVFHHTVINTDELLKDHADLRVGIIGGKTGLTPQADGCLLLIVRTPDNKGEIINVILGSQDRFGEMKKLVDWLQKAYKW